MHGGGISTYCYFTARMLSEAGHAITVFTQDDGVSDFVITNELNNIRLVRFNSNRDKVHTFLGYVARLSYAFASIVKKLIETEGKPDFIEAQDYLGIAYYITQFKHTGYKFLSEVPIVVTLHSPAFIYLEYNRVPIYCYPDFWTGEMEKQSISAADALISPTHFLVREIQKHISFSGKNTAVIANPYSTEQVTNFGFKRNHIIYYGKLSPQKGSFELLSYFKKLWDNGFTHSLHVIGGTDIVYQPDLQTMGQVIEEKYTAYLAKGLLKLHGKIQPSEISASIQDAHLIIVPSIVDNMPYVVMEAMSMGKVVLASRQGGQAEMIEEGVSGFLFDHNEPATFAAQLNKILSYDDAAIKQIASNAAQHVSNQYAFKTILSQKTRFLQQVKINVGRQNNFPFLHQEPQMPIAKDESVKDMLSVVIPFYNMGNYIDECIQSVTDSSYKKIEILVVNDGSCDAFSIKKLDEQRVKKGVTVIDRLNEGLAATRNIGAVIAKGEYLAFLDADDKVAPSYYEKAVLALAQNNNVFFAGSWVQYFENSNAVWPAFTPQPPYALVHNPINSSGLVYKRSAFLAGGINDHKTDYGLEDYESVISLLHNGFNGIVLPEILFYYRVRSGSMFRNISREKLLYSNKYIAEKHKDYYAKFAIQLINLLNANGPGYLYDNPTFKINVSSKSTGENLLLFKFKNLIKKNERLKKIALTLRKIN
ncbi:MAG: glycosyl transferase family 2 [Ferruginibacter sp.]|nr:glycosyl transferase family 2 [Ferruginibacter sp.]